MLITQVFGSMNMKSINNSMKSQVHGVKWQQNLIHGRTDSHKLSSVLYTHLIFFSQSGVVVHNTQEAEAGGSLSSRLVLVGLHSKFKGIHETLFQKRKFIEVAE